MEETKRRSLCVNPCVKASQSFEHIRVPARRSFVKQVNIGTMLANHHHASIGLKRSNIRYNWLANVGPAEFCPMGQYWHFVGYHHHTSIGPITVQHQISLVGESQPLC